MHAKQFVTSNQEWTRAPSGSVVRQMVLSLSWVLKPIKKSKTANNGEMFLK